MIDTDLFTDKGLCPNCECDAAFTITEFERDGAFTRLDLECDACDYLFQIEVLQTGICELERKAIS